jgi:hypothetical protein|tara:strand:- start:135 stop:557 length:423 start_codon:yes stop_codon:yes gene_type:complete
MKLHIVNPEQDTIEGYERVEVLDGNIDLRSYADNECELILASDCLNGMSIEQVHHAIVGISQKMRLNGRLIIGGLDIRLLARHIIRGGWSTPEANENIFGNRSCLEINYTKNLIKSCGLTIDSTRVLGLSYEIEATRKLG